MEAYDRPCYLSANIRALRASENLSRAELAAIVGLSSVQLGKIEAGVTADPGVFVVEPLATYFGFFVQEILWKKLEPKDPMARCQFQMEYELPIERQKALIESISGMIDARINTHAFDRRRRKRS